LIEIISGAVVFTLIMLMLAGIILIARSRLIPNTKVDILVNDERTVSAAVGQKLLGVLTDEELFLGSACGGKGTCGQCRVQVLSGGGALLPTEATVISRRDARQHVRLACQVAVREPMKIQVPDEVFGVRRWNGTVRSTRSVATFIRELVFELPEPMEFKAGSYILVECPEFVTDYSDFHIEPKFRPDWDALNLWRYRVENKTPTTRAYSMANHPGESQIVMLNVRIATPPPGAAANVPPGVVSSWLYSLQAGDTITLSGPYGDFFARESKNEMVFIGGGAGMAPMRSHIFDQLLRLQSKRQISYWYGARSLRELFYAEEFDRLAAAHANFNWTVALSDPLPEDDWDGPIGFIHRVLNDQYLGKHAAPEECEYYICGPPVMLAAVLKLLDDLGVPNDQILYDDFGG